MLNIREPEKQVQMPSCHLITAARAFTLKLLQERRHPRLEQLAAIFIPGHLFFFLQLAHILEFGKLVNVPGNALWVMAIAKKDSENTDKDMQTGICYSSFTTSS